MGLDWLQNHAEIREQQQQQLLLSTDHFQMILDEDVEQGAGGSGEWSTGKYSLFAATVPLPALCLAHHWVIERERVEQEQEAVVCTQPLRDLFCLRCDIHILIMIDIRVYHHWAIERERKVHF